MDYADRIRIGFERFNRRDWDAVAQGLPEDFVAIDHVAPEKREATGPHALRTITSAAGDSVFDEMHMEVTDVEIVDGDSGEVHAVCRVAAKASGGASGVPVSGEVVQIWTFREGSPSRFEQFRTREEASRATGHA